MDEKNMVVSEPVTYYLPSVIPAIITPYKKGTGVDFKGLEKVICNITSSSLGTIVFLGHTGEAQSLQLRQKMDILDCAAQLSKTVKFNAIVHVTGPDLYNSAVISCYASALGFQLQMFAPLAIWGEDPIIAMGQLLGDSSKEARFLLYDNPQLLPAGSTVTSLGYDFVASYVKHRQVFGIKYSGNNAESLDWLSFMKKQGFMVFLGNDNLLSAAMPELTGIISGTAGIYPLPFQDFLQTRSERDLGRIRDHIAHVRTLGNGDYILGLKKAAVEMGLIASADMVR